jgi:amidase
MGSIAEETQWLDATDQAALVRSGTVSPVELVDAAAERAERLNPAINALTYTWFDDARAAAQQLPADNTMPFRGVPFVLKDLHAAMEGKPLSNGNVALKNAHHISNYTTEHVKRFIEAGLIIVGRGNSPELAACQPQSPKPGGQREHHGTPAEFRVALAAAALRQLPRALSLQRTPVMAAALFAFLRRVAGSLG